MKILCNFQMSKWLTDKPFGNSNTMCMLSSVFPKSEISADFGT